MEETKTANEDRYGWIGDGIPELQEGDVDLVLEPIVNITQERYEELVRAEATLEILCRVLKTEHPYNFDIYQAIAGEKLIGDEAEVEKQ